MNINIVLTEEDIESIKRHIDYEDSITIGDVLSKIITQAHSKKKKVCTHVYQKNSTIPACILCEKIKPE